MSRGELHGVIVPVITPTDNREDVDEPAFRRHIRRLLRSGVHGIFVGGSAGEGPLLTNPQWRRMSEIAHDEVRGEVPLLGGVMDTSSRRIDEKITTLRDIGYRYFVLTPTFYIAVRTAEEHLRLFGRAKDGAGDMEMVAYNIPQCTNSALSVKTICEMAKRGWIRCCKESSGDWPYFQELLRRSEEVGLCVLSGDERTSGEALLAGARGVVPVNGNYDPALFLGLYEAGVRGDRATVSALMARVDLLRETLVLSGPCWLSGIKHAVACLGSGLGSPLSPLEPVDAQRIARIDALVKSDLASHNIAP